MISDHRQLVVVLAHLYIDEEFAQRLRLMEGESIHDPLVAYLRGRGVDASDAEILAMAYLAGSTHTLLSTKRALERICAEADARKARTA